MKTWSLQSARARLGEVVKAATEDGPQQITIRGKPAAVVLSRAEYERLVRRKPGFREFLRCSPLVGVDLDLERDRSSSRDAEL